MKFNRRSFMSTGAAAIGAMAIADSRSEAQLIYQHSDWKFAEFNKLASSQAAAKQIFDVRLIAEGKFLNNIKNSLNGLHFGFGLPAAQIKIAAALHGPSNLLNFDSTMWAKYRLGEFGDLIDPQTGKPATRNIFLQKSSSTSSDLTDRKSTFQDTQIEALQQRGVQFLSCHTATEEQANGLVNKYKLKATAEEVVQDLQAHTIPGVLIVPSMVATISLLQSRGHFTYITV